MSSTQALELFCKKWNAKEVHSEEWVRVMCPTICRATLKNWLKLMKEHGRDALAGRHGLHRKGSGNIDSQACVKACILKGIEDGKNSVEILACLKSDFSQTSVKIPSLRRIQAWIKERTTNHTVEVPAIPPPNLSQLYERTLAMGQEIQYLQTELKKMMEERQ